MRVRATREGHFGIFRKPGDVFDVPDGAKASWWEKVKDGEAKASSSSSASSAELAKLRAEFETVAGRKPGSKWGIAAIKAKLADIRKNMSR